MYKNEAIERLRAKVVKLETTILKTNPKLAISLKRLPSLKQPKELIEFWDSLSNEDKKKYKSYPIPKLRKLKFEKKTDKDVTLEVNMVKDNATVKITKKLKIKELFKKYL